MLRFSYKRIALTVFIFYAVLLFLWLKTRDEPLLYYQSADDDEESLQSIKNTTLGFEKIFTIGFSDRTDKRDAVTLAASLLDLEVDWIDGVDYRTMNRKAFPALWTDEKHQGKPGDIGAWRAHMNALQMIVRNKISSALILEDDVDFDVSIKAQLTEFARGSRVIQETQGNPITSPYGDDWDMLWLGYCGMKILEEQRGEKRRIFVIPNDPTLRPPHHKEQEFWGPTIAEFPGMEPHRMIFDAADGVCSLAFGITYEGARKALAAFSMMGLDEPMDLSYRYLCNGQFPLRFRCLAPYPTLISSWRQAGMLWRDSDIIETAPEEWHDAHSFGIVYSTMLNAIALANGSKTARAQWDDVAPLEIEPETFEIPRGVLWLPDQL